MLGRTRLLPWRHETLSHCTNNKLENKKRRKEEKKVEGNPIIRTFCCGNGGRPISHWTLQPFDGFIRKEEYLIELSLYRWIESCYRTAQGCAHHRNSIGHRVRPISVGSAAHFSHYSYCYRSPLGYPEVAQSVDPLGGHQASRRSSR